MRTWEMIKELTENPGKKFISKDRSNGTLHCVLNSNLLQFEYECRKDGKKVYIDTERVWEEVRKPVDFTTAIESGYRVRVEHPFISEPHELEQFSRQWKCFTELFEIFGKAWDEHDVRKILLEGKWYVEF